MVLERARHAVVGRAERFGRRQVERDCADIRLVGERVRHRFEHHGKADTVRRGGRLLQRARQLELGLRQAGRSERGPGAVLVPGALRPVQAQTRQALIDAAVRLIAEGRRDRASIAEITEEADIGFGSFYNHFDSKEQLFQTASEEVLERWGQLIDRVWGSDYVGDTKTLDVHVKRLRAKIEPEPSDPRHLLTVRGLGYKFEA